MKLNIRQVLSIDGERKSLDLKIPLEELANIKGFEFSTPISVVGEIINRAGVVNLTFTVDFSLSLLCDRCLTPFERQYTYNFNHTVVRAVSNSNKNHDDEYIIADGDFIDITDIVLCDVLLELPYKFLCKEDCKGLCQYCGTNLNDSTCNCSN